jgi:hypothetical protein
MRSPLSVSNGAALSFLPGQRTVLVAELQVPDGRHDPKRAVTVNRPPVAAVDPLDYGLFAAPSSPTANATVLDDLVDALVADAEGLGNLAHRCASQVQAPDRSTVFPFGSLELVLELSDPASRGVGLSQQVLINWHLSVTDRQTAGATPAKPPSGLGCEEGDLHAAVRQSGPSAEWALRRRP